LVCASFHVPRRAAHGQPGHHDDRDRHEHGKPDKPPRGAEPMAPLPRLLRPRTNLVSRRQSNLAPIVRGTSGFVVGSERSGSRVGSIDLVTAVTLVDCNPQLFCGFDRRSRIEFITSRRRSAGGAVAVDCSVEATFRTAPDPSSFQVAPNGLSARTIFQGRIIFRELAAPFANKLVVAFHESIRC